MIFLGMLSTSFAVPMALQKSGEQSVGLRWLPSVWFLGLFQSVRSGASLAEIRMEHTALIALGIAFALTVVTARLGLASFEPRSTGRFCKWARSEPASTSFCERYFAVSDIALLLPRA